MYVARVPNRGSPPAILLRESYREGGKVKNRTLANLSRWPEHKVDALSRALKGLPPARDLSEAFEITRSLPHGHVAAVLGTSQRLGLPELIDATPSRNRDLVSAMLIAQVIGPGSKLATARGLRTQTATSSLGQVLGVSGCDEDDLYAAMDWALARKEAIENTLAARHLSEGTLVLYDVSSAALEGRTCPLGAIGHPRDGVKGRLQIVYGLLCTTAGIPIAIEVFEGNTADPKTLAAQIGKVNIALRVGKVINHYKMAKHFTLEITDESFTFTRNSEAIAAEAALDGIYVLRTSLPEQTLNQHDVVLRYKNLADVERFFRTLNTELDIRPIRHRLADRVRAHVFLRMLSYYISWHMKQALAPILFVDNDKPAAATK